MIHMRTNSSENAQRKIQLLFILNELAAGGVQRLVVDFANKLHGDRFSVSVATLLDGPKYSFHRDQLHPDIELKYFHFKKFWDVAAWYRLYRYIRRNEFDVVFTQLFMSDLFGRTAAYLARTPVIVTAIQNLIPSLPKKYIWTDRILARITDACISPTPAISAYAGMVIKFPLWKIRLLPTNAVDERRFKTPFDRGQIRRSIDVSEHGRMIISVGRLIEQKGHTVLLRAIPKVLQQHPDTYVVVAGGGELEPALKKEAGELGITSHVRFLGERKDIPDLLRSADVFVFPSLWEGQGIVLFEAMFSGLPIVASRTGGIPDVIENERTGLLCEPGNADELARALIRILGDESLRERLTTEALRRFSDRTMEESAKKMGDLFIELLEKKIGHTA